MYGASYKRTIVYRHLVMIILVLLFSLLLFVHLHVGHIRLNYIKLDILFGILLGILFVYLSRLNEISALAALFECFQFKF